MPLDPRIQAALAALPPRPPDTGTPAERRARVHDRSADTAPILRPPTDRLDERDFQVPGPHGHVPVRVYRPSPGVLPGLIFIHGGGWWLGTLDDGDAYCRQRATGLDCVVMAIDYRLAPEHPFPLPLDDCWAATQWIFEHADELGVDPSRVAISGGSAGANLAAAVTLLAREHGGAPFVAQLLEVPATDLTMEVGRGSIEEFAEGFVLSKADLIECAEFYLGGHDPRDPLASPYFADLHDLPPALVMTCECDPVRDDGEAYAGRLAEAGVPTVMRRWEGMVHGSAELAVIVPDVAEAYTAEVHAFLSRQFSARTV